MIVTGEFRDIRINHIPILRCPPKISHELAWDRTRVSEVTGCIVHNTAEVFHRRRSAIFKGNIPAFVGTSRELRNNSIRLADSPFFYIPDAINCRVLLAASRELGIPHALLQTVDVNSQELCIIHHYILRSHMSFLELIHQRSPLASATYHRR
jgi:hypothetical protein